MGILSPKLLSPKLATQTPGYGALMVLSGDPEPHRWAVEHRDIIRQFGRFPHRNAILGRSSTAEELAYLAAGGFGG